MAYGMTKMMACDPMYLSVAMNNNSNFDVTYRYVLSNDSILTFTHPMPNEVMGGSYTTYKDLVENAHSLSAYAISTIFNIKRDLSGI